VRILLVTDCFGLGGAQRQIVELGKGLARRGHEVAFFAYHRGLDHFLPQVEEAGIPVHWREKRSRFSLLPPLRLWRLARRYDVAVAFLRTPAVYAELASLLPGFPPLLVSERSSSGHRPRTVATRARERLHRLADHVVFNAHHEHAAWTARHPWLRGRSSVIVNGTDLERFRPASEREAGDGDGLRLVAVGTVEPGKNPHGLVRALGELRRRGAPIPSVTWVGRRGSERGDDRYLRDLEALIEGEGLRDRWSWHGPTSDVPAILRAHDALVHPSFFEGCPNAICEALACGLPVLAGDVCDHRRLVIPGETGYLFDPEHPSSIADALVELAGRERGARRAMGEAARAFAGEVLGVERMVEEFETVIGQLAGAGGGPVKSASAVPAESTSEAVRW
jgi:glycosyltransferase involved in cell wall biosynthesis